MQKKRNRSEASHKHFNHRLLRSELVRPGCCQERQGPDIRECFLKLNLLVENVVRNGVYARRQTIQCMYIT